MRWLILMKHHLRSSNPLCILSATWIQYLNQVRSALQIIYIIQSTVPHSYYQYSRAYCAQKVFSKIYCNKFMSTDSSFIFKRWEYITSKKAHHWKSYSISFLCEINSHVQNLEHFAILKWVPKYIFIRKIWKKNDVQKYLLDKLSLNFSHGYFD